MQTVRLIIGFVALFLTWITIVSNEVRLVPFCIGLWGLAISPGL